jgi:hypothetical protein
MRECAEREAPQIGCAPKVIPLDGLHRGTTTVVPACAPEPAPRRAPQRSRRVKRGKGLGYRPRSEAQDSTRLPRLSAKSSYNMIVVRRRGSAGLPLEQRP